MFECLLQKRQESLPGTMPKKFTTTIGVHGESIVDELSRVNLFKGHQGAFHAAEKAAKKAKEAPLILNSMRFRQAIKNETGYSQGVSFFHKCTSRMA